jgi:translation initiation factor 3 subunit H
LTIRAYRLTRKALELACNGDWSPESTKQSGLNFGNFFEELPIVVKNSHLMNVLLAEMALARKGKKPITHLELGTKRSLER